MNSKRLAVGSAILLVLVLSSCSADDTAGGDENYFDGQTITWIIPSGPGSGSDTLARLYGDYLIDHLPGEPEIVFEFMEGGGGVEAANYLANVAESDGLTIGTASQDAFMAQMTGTEGVAYDFREFTFLGNFTADDQMLIVRSDLGIDSFDDLLNVSEPIRGGAHSPSHPVARMPLLLDAVFADVDMFEMTYGYAGGAELLLDMERGALDARSTSIGTLMTNQPEWIDDRFVVPLVYAQRERHADFPDVPALSDVVPEESQPLLELIYAPSAVSRALATTPELPENAEQLLTEAFEDMAEDEDLAAEVEALGFLFGFTSGEEIRTAVDNVASDEDLVETLKGLVQG